MPSLPRTALQREVSCEAKNPIYTGFLDEISTDLCVFLLPNSAKQ